MNFQEKIEIYKDIIVSLDYCINDYLYILDVENDEYFSTPPDDFNTFRLFSYILLTFLIDHLKQLVIRCKVLYM